MKNAQPESAMQKSIVKHLRERGYFVAHIPNGSKLAGSKEQRARTGARLKSEGLMAGFPDLYIAHSEGRAGFIEVKAEGAYQQPSQKECQAELERRGHRYAVCRSLADVDETLAEWNWI